MIGNTNYTSLANLQNTGFTAGQVNSMQKLSSGSRIVKAADDAAGLAVSENMRGTLSGLSTASTNAQSGISALQTAEGGLEGTTSVLQRMNELATQSANGTYSDSDREMLNKEFTELKDSLNQISQNTNYNGQKLLDGSIDKDNAMTLQVGATSEDRVSFAISDMSATGLNIADLDISTAEGAGAALDSLKGAIDNVSSTRGDIGSTMNRLESTINGLDLTHENLSAAESSVRDIDMAKEMIDQTTSRIREEASVAVAAQAMNLSSQKVLSLFTH